MARITPAWLRALVAVALLAGLVTGAPDETLGPALTSHLKDNLDVPYHAGDMFDGTGTKIGTKIGVWGPMDGPSRQHWMITSIWGIDHDGTVRFLTAVPGP